MRTKHELIMSSIEDVVASLLLYRDNKPWYIPEQTRRHLIKQSGSVCAVCRIKTDRPHIDHILPVSMGGTCHLDNLQVLCSNCNLTKSCHGLDPKSYEVGYVIPIKITTQRKLNDELLERLYRDA